MIKLTIIHLICLFNYFYHLFLIATHILNSEYFPIFLEFINSVNHYLIIINLIFITNH